MMLLADAILIGLDNITDGLIVYPKRISAHVQSELGIPAAAPRLWTSTAVPEAPLKRLWRRTRNTSWAPLLQSSTS
ncbi:hypothetical protein B0T10DRAFT_469417, partial [Thelonectria olida]